MESFYARLYRYLICGSDDPPYISRALLTIVVFIALSVTAFPGFSSQNLPVSLVVSGMNVTLDNKLIKFQFREDGSAAHIIKDGEDIISPLSGASRDPSKTRSAYLDYYVKGVKDFTPDHVKIIKNTTDIAHVAYVDNYHGLLKLEYHLIMRRGVSGLYSYVLAENSSKNPVVISELRNVYRFNPTLFENIFNGEHTGKPLLYSQLEKLPKLQDETWRLPNGEVYTKYDFAGYQRHNLWGVYGHDFAAWLIHASGEYFSGDRLKQDLLAHQDGIILNYMTGAHLGTPDMVVPPCWQKLYGPWLLYINRGDAVQTLNDARSQLYSERASWPYRWTDDPRYPLVRTHLYGRVATRQSVTVVLNSSLDEPFDQQTRGYLFSAMTDKDGKFHLDNLRPGLYQLSVYANGGTQPGVLFQQPVTVGGAEQTLPAIVLPAERPVIWAIGQADRQAREFRFGNEIRGYHWRYDVPASLTFDIGYSDYRHDWYYAQTKPGIWDIRFHLTPNKPSYWLNIALAAASNSGMSQPTTPQLAVKINGKTVETLHYTNDKTLYRSALRNGRYHLARVPINRALLLSGNNTISLELQGGGVMYDVITFSE